MGASVAAVTVDQITRGWRAGPLVSVVHDYREFPHAAPPDAKGMFCSAGVFVAANQPAYRIPQVLNHEAIGHAGIRREYGATWKSFMCAIQRGARAGDQVLVRLQADVRQIYIDADGALELRPIAEADEMAAMLAEIVTDPTTGRIAIPDPLKNRFRAAWGHAAREVLLLDYPADFKQLLGSLLAAEQHIRYGGPAFGIRHRLWSVISCAPMGKPTGANPPPRNLAESESLLRAEEYRRQSPGEWKFLGSFLLVVVGGLCAVAGILYWALLLTGIVRL